MRVKELIEILRTMPTEDEVRFSDNDREVDNVYVDPDKKVTYIS